MHSERKCHKTETLHLAFTHVFIRIHLHLTVPHSITFTCFHAFISLTLCSSSHRREHSHIFSSNFFRLLSHFSFFTPHLVYFPLSNNLLVHSLFLRIASIVRRFSLMIVSRKSIRNNHFRYMYSHSSFCNVRFTNTINRIDKVIVSSSPFRMRVCVFCVCVRACVWLPQF